MYQFSYAEIQTDSVAEAKDRERQLLSRSIDLLAAGREKGSKSIEATQAIHFLNRVWTTFIEDLGSFAPTSSRSACGCCARPRRFGRAGPKISRAS